MLNIKEVTLYNSKLQKLNMLYNYVLQIKRSAFKHYAAFEQDRDETPTFLKKLGSNEFIHLVESFNEKTIIELAKKDYDDIMNENDSMEIPTFFTNLIKYDKKSQAEKIIKDLKVPLTNENFHAFYWHCEKLGFCYSSSHIEKPSCDIINLKPLNPNSQTLLKDIRKHRKLLFNLKQNKKISWHLFEDAENPLKWHLFYFSWDDVFTKEDNHYKDQNGNPTRHMHYTSYLFGLDKMETLQQLNSGKYSVNSFHIKYNHYED